MQFPICGSSRGPQTSTHQVCAHTALDRHIRCVFMYHPTLLVKLTIVLACHSQLRVGAGKRSVLSVASHVCASSARQVIDQRKQLKDAGFSDRQADTILTVTAAPGSETATQNELAYFRTENRLLFLLVVLVICLSAPTGTPVGDLVQGVFGPVVDSDVTVEGLDLMNL